MRARLDSRATFPRVGGSPLQLKFNFLLIALALVLDGGDGTGGHVNPLVVNLNRELLAFFERIGKAPQLLDEPRQGIPLFNVALARAADG